MAFLYAKQTLRDISHYGANTRIWIHIRGKLKINTCYLNCKDNRIITIACDTVISIIGSIFQKMCGK